MDAGSVLQFAGGALPGTGILATGNAVNVTINGLIDPPNIGANMTGGAGGI